ncbi:MAG: CRTAC1 family protein [Bryobacteraceae bacterium]
MSYRRGTAAAAFVGTWALLLAAQRIPRSIAFEDVTKKAGIDFVLRNAATGDKHLIETMAGGVAVLDFDNDGKPDIYFVNGAGFNNCLFRNNGDGTFRDVTAAAGVSGSGFGMGAAAGDFDNDGFADLFVVGVHGNILYRNRGNGRFEDVTKRAGLGVIGPAKWAVAAGWFDYDNDGRLDLFVVNYVKWDPASEPFCGDAARNYRTYCHPKHYAGLPNSLYHNNGDGTFSDVSQASGIGTHIGKGMGLAFADYDGDGLVDVFVANDTVPNFLFHNDGNGRFTERGMRAGVAINDDGRALSSMGVEFRDINNDGRPDLFMTALANETFPLFFGLEKGLFEDVTYRTRLGVGSLAISGWGTGAYDFDNDGWKDLFAAAGDVQDNTELFSSRKSHQTSTVFRNAAGRGFDALPVGPAGLHRGAAFADFDGDGRMDAVVTRLNEPAELYRNVSPNQNHWLRLRLIGTSSNRDANGAAIHLTTRSGEQWNHVTSSVGYASSSELAVHFGLGGDTVAQSVDIRWPSGKRQTLTNVMADFYLTVTEP